MQPQVLHGHLREIEASRGPEGKPESCRIPLPVRPACERQVGRVGEIFRAADLDRPKDAVMSRPVLALRAAVPWRLAAQRTSAANGHTGTQACIFELRFQLGDQHGRYRRKELRIQDLRHALSEAWKL